MFNFAVTQKIISILDHHQLARHHVFYSPSHTNTQTSSYPLTKNHPGTTTRDYMLNDCEVRNIMADNNVVIGERKRNRSINDHNVRAVMVGF